MVKTLKDIRKDLGKTINEIAELCEVSPKIWKECERALLPPAEITQQKIIRSLQHLTRTRITSDIFASKDTQTEEKIIGEGYVTAKPNSQKIFEPTNLLKSSGLKVLDLFCGAGGLSHGFESLPEFNVTCGVDLLEDRVKTFHSNHPHAFGFSGDLREIPSTRLKELCGDFDVIVGGPPCQGFSSIRPFRNLTEGDSRNSLPEQYLLAVSAFKPKWVIFENVVGILSHKKGNIFRQVISGLEDLGYTVSYRVINAAELGVPQYRERVYVIGRLGQTCFDWLLPSHRVYNSSMAGGKHPTLERTPLFVGNLLEPISVGDAIDDLPHLESGQISDQYDSEPRTDYQRQMRNNSQKLTLHSSTNHSEKMLEIISHAGKNRSALPKNLTSSGFSSCYSRLSAEEPSTTITVNFVNPSSNRCIHPTQNRALTPREGARLQGFSDDYIFIGSRTQITKQIGNAVPPLVSKEIAKMLLSND